MDEGTALGADSERGTTASRLTERKLDLDPSILPTRLATVCKALRRFAVH